MDSYKQLLKDNGIQITRQRLEVLRVLRELNTHVTVDDVIAALEERNINLTVATVYNILNLFEKKDLIMKINAAGEPVIFDVNTHKHAHICDRESRHVMDFPDNGLLAAVDEYLCKHPVEGMTVERIDVNLIGKFQK
jgi:Fur family peroxide stress response transcriptional regulator